MCGICGFVLEERPAYDRDSVVHSMTDRMRHRGPDDEGFWHKGKVSLGHRRLNIIDLESGRQPIANEDGSVVVVFNGEIYNYRELRSDLIEKGHRFATNSDTEILVHLWEEIGTELPERLNGMFAFALWDQRRQALFAARDRMGEKPLYWSWSPAGLVFASELTSLMAHPAVTRELDPASVGKYLLFDCVPSPGTILKGARKLEPGTWLLYEQGNPRLGRYWDLSFPSPRQRPPSFAEASEELRSKLRRAVEMRLVADVPLGVFLSGGIDSSTVTALMCDLVGPPGVRSFSVGFSDPSFDESSYARLVAQSLGTVHHAQTLDASTMVELLPGIISRLDEPLADNSLIPTYFLARFARSKVTVALGGDGGDELCLGYPTFQAHRIARWYARLPGWFRRAVAGLVATLPVSTGNISRDYQARQFIRGMEYDRFARHFVWIGSVPPREQAALLTPEFQSGEPELLLDDVARHANNCKGRDDFDVLTYLYSKLYMCDDILTKVDRAAMMHSLEARAPMLDHEVVDFFTAMPTRYKLSGLTTKRLLRSAFGERLPRPVVKRAKKGFGVPVAEWLKGPLRPWVEELLSPASLRRHGLFSPTGVHRLWEEHLAGLANHRKPLWSVIVMLLWMDEHLGS